MMMFCIVRRQSCVTNGTKEVTRLRPPNRLTATRFWFHVTFPPTLTGVEIPVVVNRRCRNSAFFPLLICEARDALALPAVLRAASLKQSGIRFVLWFAAKH